MNLEKQLSYTTFYDSVANFIVSAFNKIGVVVKRYNPSTAESALIGHLIRQYKVSTVLDVGAAVGLFGKKLRAMGYQGTIYSFEPIKKSFAQLEKRSATDAMWKTFNMGLGAKEETMTLNISLNSDSSSLLEMHDTHVKNAEIATYQSKETISIKTLDQVLSQNPAAGNIYLKLDVQGFEKLVLEGAAHTLAHVCVIQSELSLTTLYHGGSLLEEMVTLLRGKGFELYSLTPGFKNKRSGQLFQMDGFFIRKDLLT